MILTGRDGKPIIFNNTHIVAVSVADEVHPLQCKTLIHCIGHSFFVKESIEEVYLAIYSEPMSEPDRSKYGLIKPTPTQETLPEVSQSEIRSNFLPIRRARRPSV